MTLNCISEIFETRVLEVQLLDHEEMDAEIRAEIESMSRENAGTAFNIWDHAGPGLNKLRDHFIKYGNMLSLNGPVSVSRGWVTHRKKFGLGKGEAVPHGHRTYMVGVYYLDVAPGDGGDLLLLDPRGSTDWCYLVQEPGEESGTFYTVKARAGKLVMFPGYLVHMVRPVISMNERRSIATNLEKRLPLMGG